MIDIFDDLTNKDHLPAVSEKELSDGEVMVELSAIKKRLGSRVVVLGHHYQQDDVISFADIKGDSLELARKAARLKMQNTSCFVVFTSWRKRRYAHR